MYTQELFVFSGLNSNIPKRIKFNNHMSYKEDQMEKREKATALLSQILTEAIEEHQFQKRERFDYEADRYKARGRVEGIADAWDVLYGLGLVNQRDKNVYGG